MNLAAAIAAAAPGAPAVAAESLAELEGQTAALATPQRAAHLIGQCAHESLGFTRTVESLWYSAERLMAVWPSRFRSKAKAEEYAGDPEKLANQVYGGRLGNNEPGDGWRYRGRGWLQLTGRANYRRYGRALGIDLEAEPDLAEEPRTAWLVACLHLATRRRMGRTALAWADEDNPEMVTRIVNGGLNGLDDRRARTAAALMAVTGAVRPVQRGAHGPVVLRLQQLLAARGHPVGALDGYFGPRTERAVCAFQLRAGLEVDGIAGPATWAALAA